MRGDMSGEPDLLSSIIVTVHNEHLPELQDTMHNQHFREQVLNRDPSQIPPVERPQPSASSMTSSPRDEPMAQPASTQAHAPVAPATSLQTRSGRTVKPVNRLIDNL